MAFTCDALLAGEDEVEDAQLCLEQFEVSSQVVPLEGRD